MLVDVDVFERVIVDGVDYELTALPACCSHDPLYDDLVDSGKTGALATTPNSLAGLPIGASG